MMKRSAKIDATNSNVHEQLLWVRTTAYNSHTHSSCTLCCFFSRLGFIVALNKQSCCELLQKYWFVLSIFFIHILYSSSLHIIVILVEVVVPFFSIFRQWANIFSYDFFFSSVLETKDSSTFSHFWHMNIYSNDNKCRYVCIHTRAFRVRCFFFSRVKWYFCRFRQYFLLLNI